MRLIAAPLVAVLAAGFGALAAAPASAHTPAISATCSGVHVGATAYDPGMANRWSVTINGATQSGTFGASFDQTFPVPQDGATSTWSAYVEAADGTYHGAGSGQVGPCGTPPADACTMLPGTQPVGTPCTPPPDVTRTGAGQLADCTVTLAGHTYGAGLVTYDEQYTDTYVFNQATNTWDLVTDDQPTIANVAFTPWSVAQQIRHDCVDQAAQPPADHSQHQSTHVDCADSVAVVTTVETTTPYVYDASTNTWSPGQPVTHTSTQQHAVQPGDCDMGVSATVAAAPTRAPSAAVPSAVDAGLAGARPADATVLASGSVRSDRSPGEPALLLFAAGGALLGAGPLRLRRG